MPVAMKTIDLMYFNAGGGHRSAADALDTVIRELALPWQVRLIDLFDVLDPRGVFSRTTAAIRTKSLSANWLRSAAVMFQRIRRP